MASILEAVQKTEREWDTFAAIKYTGEHTEIPVFAVCIYLAIVFYVPDLLKDRKGLKLRGIWGYWNLLLSLFSIIGACRTVPYLMQHVNEKGFQYTTCNNASEWFLKQNNNPTGFWVTLFIYSKVPELIDTVFLVLQKKPVIFLHWFHHVTVLLYCWHAFANNTASGLWFVAMNFSVHAVMYFYYFLSISGYKKLAHPMAPLITTIQLIQMVVGTLVTFNTARTINAGLPCAVDHANYKLGLAMYISYFVLFAILFYNLYLAPGGKHRRKKTKGGKEESQVVCGVEMNDGDAAGFFHTNNDDKKKK
jgi:hypothetical protein